jgi:type I restriction enzyme S subunit
VQYAYYQLLARRPELERLGTGTTFAELGRDQLASLRFWRPEVQTQHAIADFLDRETEKIDTLVAKKQRLIELLNEKRSALVERVALGGLRGRGAGKSLGIGRATVPSTWAVRRARYVMRERDERSSDGAEDLLTVSHITGVTLRSEKQVSMFEAESNEGYKVCRTGDLAVNTMWAFMGAAGVAPCNGIVSPSYNVYRFLVQGEPRYYDYLVRTSTYVSEFASRSKGIWRSRLRLYPAQLLDIALPVPPLREQEEIVRYLDKQTSAIDGLIEPCRRSIELLKERRSALVTAAVSGQIDVRKYTMGMS